MSAPSTDPLTTFGAQRMMWSTKRTKPTRSRTQKRRALLPVFILAVNRRRSKKGGKVADRQRREEADDADAATMLCYQWAIGARGRALPGRGNAHLGHELEPPPAPSGAPYIILPRLINGIIIIIMFVCKRMQYCMREMCLALPRNS